MRNLVIAVCGNNSFHTVWTEKNPKFDLFVVYYSSGKNYEKDGRYYDEEKGSKFNILAKIVCRHSNVFSRYDAIFVPDDDLYLTTESINRFFDIFHGYKLSLAQPSIVGWASIPITLHVPQTVLRYTNWVEIMCPCFDNQLFHNALPTFTENRTNWGIELLWNKILGSPQDKIAIVDDVVAIHTRPCFFGDTYQNNGTGYEVGMDDVNKIVEKYKLQTDWTTYGSVKKCEGKFMELPSQNRFYPDVPILKDLIGSIKPKPRLL